jgi:predicted phage terminase large subunit-like protein
MGDPSGYEGRLFKTDWLEQGYYTVDEELIPRYGNLDYYMSIDPNISEEPKSDNTAICTIAVDRVHKDIYVLDFYAKPLDFLDQVHALRQYGSRPQLRVGKNFLPGEQRILKIGVESIAYQKSLQRTGYVMGLPVVEVQHGKMDKITRLLRLQPHFENQRIKFPDPEVHKTSWWDEFYDEYTTFPRSRRDDLLDALEVVVEVSGVANPASGIPWYTRRGRSDGRPEAVAPWKEKGYRRSILG